MTDLPAELPDKMHNEIEVSKCIVKASKSYKVDPLVLASIRRVEGGKRGQYSKNTNGTIDMGPMQINSIWIDDVEKFGITRDGLLYDTCVNVYVSAWILKKEINGVNGDLWRGVGNYHSRTPKFHNSYVGKVKKAYYKLFKEIYGVDL